MPRDDQSIKIRSWADAGQRATPDDVRFPTTRDAGWTLGFSLTKGPPVERLLMNQILREVTGMLVELNAGGSVPEWSSLVDYEHVAFVRHEGSLYVSTRYSGPIHGGATEPGTEGSAWRIY